MRSVREGVKEESMLPLTRRGIYVLNGWPRVGAGEFRRRWFIIRLFDKRLGECGDNVVKEAPIPYCRAGKVLKSGGRRRR